MEKMFIQLFFGPYSRKRMILCVCAVFLFVLVVGEIFRASVSRAQVYDLPEPTVLVDRSAAFELPRLFGLRYNPQKPLELNFIFDRANGKLTGAEQKRLIRLFFAALTIPDEKLWVNLSPYERDRMVDTTVEQTEIGETLLAQDYMLKQLSSSLTYPVTELGEKYWGSLDASGGNAFNKIWIVPEKMEVYDNFNAAFVTEAALDVLTEADYLAARSNDTQKSEVKPATAKLLPAIKEEVNKGRNFARLRQLYQVLILSSWFKQKFYDTVYAKYLDQRRISGVDEAEQGFKEMIFDRYKTSFEKGTYELVENKQKYFSGGFRYSAGSSSSVSMNITADLQTVEQRVISSPLVDVPVSGVAEGLKTIEVRRMLIKELNGTPLLHPFALDVPNLEMNVAERTRTLYNSMSTLIKLFDEKRDSPSVLPEIENYFKQYIAAVVNDMPEQVLSRGGRVGPYSQRHVEQIVANVLSNFSREGLGPDEYAAKAAGMIVRNLMVIPFLDNATMANTVSRHMAAADALLGLAGSTPENISYKGLTSEERKFVENVINIRKYNSGFYNAAPYVALIKQYTSENMTSEEETLLIAETSMLMQEKSTVDDVYDYLEMLAKNVEKAGKFEHFIREKVIKVLGLDTEISGSVEPALNELIFRRGSDYSFKNLPACMQKFLRTNAAVAVVNKFFNPSRPESNFVKHILPSDVEEFMNAARNGAPEKAVYDLIRVGFVLPAVERVFEYQQREGGVMTTDARIFHQMLNILELISMLNSGKEPADPLDSYLYNELVVKNIMGIGDRNFTPPDPKAMTIEDIRKEFGFNFRRTPGLIPDKDYIAQRQPLKYLGDLKPGQLPGEAVSSAVGGIDLASIAFAGLVDAIHTTADYDALPEEFTGLSIDPGRPREIHSIADEILFR